VTARLFRLGSHAAAKDPTLSPLVTIWSYDPAQEPDGLGRRPGDRLVGVAPRDLAGDLVELVNGAEDREEAGGFVTELMQQYARRGATRAVYVLSGAAGMAS
jgi:hypothetical protein